MARFTASIDDEIKQQLDQYAKAQGLNRSEALETILREYFQAVPKKPQPAPTQPTPGPAPDHDQAKLLELDQKVHQVMNFLNTQYDYLVTIDERVDVSRTGPEVPYPEWYEFQEEESENEQ